MQEPSYVGKITFVSIWFRMVLTLIISRIYKDSLHQISIFDLYHKVLNPWVGTLILKLMLIIDTVHLPIYWSNSGINLKFEWPNRSCSFQCLCTGLVGSVHREGMTYPFIHV